MKQFLSTAFDFSFVISSFRSYTVFTFVEIKSKEEGKRKLNQTKQNTEKCNHI